MDVAKLAALARIKLTKEEEQELSKEFPAILDFVNQINGVDIKDDGKNEISEVDLVNIMRKDDESNESGHSTEKLLSLSPDRDGDYIKVKKIL